MIAAVAYSQSWSESLAVQAIAIFRNHSKAQFTPAIISKQHCRMLIVEQFVRQSRMLLRQIRTLFRHRCRFGITSSDLE